MDISVRQEEESDFREVEELTREAFWNLYRPGCDEHYLVHVMRDHPDFVRELAFVAVVEGRIVGSILYTRSFIEDEQGNRRKTATFGPLCVHPSFQRQGIGTRLVRHTKALAAGMGFPAIIILGDPHNYCLHGFKTGRDYNLSTKDGKFPLGLLALELEEGCFDGRRWMFTESDVFSLNESEAEVFDRGFGDKPKLHQPSQDIFSILVRSVVE